MYSKFNYSPTISFYNSILNRYVTIGNELFKRHEEEVQDCLSKYISEDGVINGSDLKEHWFSISQKDIFISHSHKDLNKVKAFADNTQQKNDFAKYIYPVVICDPAPFNQAVKLRSDTMLTAAIWDIILYEDKSKYEPDFDMIIVPEVDVEQHCTKLFGTGLVFEHQSILGAEVQFYYDETIKSYRIPANPKYLTYSPYVEEITKVGERYTLLVGYVSPAPAWLTLNEDDEPVPDKYMEYVVSKRGEEMTLITIQESSRKGHSYYEHYGIEEEE